MFRLPSVPRQARWIPPTTPHAPRLHPGVPVFTGADHDQRCVRMEIAPELKALLEHPVSWFRDKAKEWPASPQEQTTHIAFVLDSSGSMEIGKEATIAGFNKQLDVVREGAALAGKTYMTLVQFSSFPSVQQLATSISSVPPLCEKTFIPSGYTALYDAIGETLAALMRQPEMGSASCATLVTIFTDGAENASCTYDAATLRAIIERLEATGRWTIALVGPQDDVATLADLLSVNPSNVTGFNPASVEERGGVMDQVAMASSNYMTARANGITQVTCLYGCEEE